MDNKQEHINEDFLDQSWANMSELLDLEMPVKRRKRRFVWLWFGGLLALTFVVITYATNLSNIEKEITPINTQKQLNTENKKTKVADNHTIDLKKEKSQNTQISTNTKSSDEPNVINTIKNLTLASSSESVSSTIGSEAGILEDGKWSKVQDLRLLIEHNKQEKEVSNLPISNKVNSKNTIEVDIEELSKNRLFIADFDPIPLLDFQPIFNQNLRIEFPVFPVKNKHNWRLGAYAGKTYPKLGSFRAGLHVQKAFNTKWSLYVGLGYARRVAKISLNQNQPLNADAQINQLPTGSMEEDNMTTGTSTAPAPGSGGFMEPEFTATNSISYQNFHYFELPVLVQYQLNHKWSLEVGGQLSRLYGYRYNNSTIADSFFNSNLSTTIYDMTRSSDQNNAEIAAWDIAALGGTAYQLNSQLQIYSSYRLGLNNYLRIDTDRITPKKWRQIELGVRYYFK